MFKTRFLTAMIVAIGLAAPAYGAIFTFSLPANSQSSGGPVDVSGSFNTNGTNVVLTLTNNEANPNNVAQLISDLFFTAVGSTTPGGGSVTPSTTYITIAPGGATSPASAPSPANWQLQNPSDANYHLTA